MVCGSSMPSWCRHSTGGMQNHPANNLLGDSAGYVVIHEPGLDGEEMFPHLRSDGYQLKADGLYQGTRIALKANQTSLVQINRTQPAERVGRITGIGRYRDAQLLGEALHRLARTLSAGCRPGFQPGRCFWAKNLLVLGILSSLGNFHTTGATSPNDVTHPVAWSYFLDGRGCPSPCFLPVIWCGWMVSQCRKMHQARKDGVHYSKRILEKQLEHAWPPLIPKKTDLIFSCYSISRINGSISKGIL